MDQLYRAFAKKSDIEILDDEYEIKYHRDDWENKDLNLKNDK
ncbi:hypothetical protein [Senegalia sp. (in: firmicutes)]